jgi:hypothetical protein
MAPKSDTGFQVHVFKYSTCRHHNLGISLYLEVEWTNEKMKRKKKTNIKRKTKRGSEDEGAVPVGRNTFGRCGTPRELNNSHEPRVSHRDYLHGEIGVFQSNRYYFPKVTFTLDGI